MKDFKKLWPYLKDSRGLIILSLFSALLATGSKLLIPYLAGRLINGLSGGISLSENEYQNLFLWMGVLLGVGTLFRYAFDYLTALLGQIAIANMRRAVFTRYQEAP